MIKDGFCGSKKITRVLSELILQIRLSMISPTLNIRQAWHHDDGEYLM